MNYIKEILFNSLDKAIEKEKIKLIENSKRITLILEGKELYIKKYTFKKGVNLNKEIANLINKQFHVSDCLFHYEVQRKLTKNNVILYSINNDFFIKNFQSRKRNISILPIQIDIFRRFKRKYKEKNFILFFRKGTIIYKLISEKGKLVFSENIEFSNFQIQAVIQVYINNNNFNLYLDENIIQKSKFNGGENYNNIYFIQEDWYSVL